MVIYTHFTLPTATENDTTSRKTTRQTTGRCCLDFCLRLGVACPRLVGTVGGASSPAAQGTCIINFFLTEQKRAAGWKEHSTEVSHGKKEGMPIAAADVFFGGHFFFSFLFVGID